MLSKPAFPIHPEAHERSDAECDVLSGMSLHDYFAAKAMQCLLASHVYNPGHAVQIAKDSKAIADAMIAARETNHE